MNMDAFMVLAAACAPLVHPVTAHALVQVESGFHPHAVGVVGGSLERQPRSRQEAIATTTALRARGFDFSVGLAQINARNLPRLQLSVERTFDPCTNLRAMQVLLVDCFDRATRAHNPPQEALRKAFSCYYSGDFVTGFRDGYVARVVHSVSSRTTGPSQPLRIKEIP